MLRLAWEPGRAASPGAPVDLSSDDSGRRCRTALAHPVVSQSGGRSHEFPDSLAVGGLIRTAADPQEAAWREPEVGGASSPQSSPPIRRQCGFRGHASEGLPHAALRHESAYPPLEVAVSREGAPLGAVAAAICEDEVAQAVIWMARPWNEVIRVDGPGFQAALAVEASPGLRFDAPRDRVRRQPFRWPSRRPPRAAWSGEARDAPEQRPAPE